MAKKNEVIKEDSKVSMRLAIPDFQSFAPVLSIEGDSRAGDFITWGENNEFPLYLLDTYNNCATLQSIINGSIDYTMGNGVRVINNNQYFKEVNEYGDSVTDVISKLVMDRWIFGGFAIQIKYNTLGHIISIAYIDFSKLRTDKMGEYIYQSDKWNGWGKNRAKKVRAFNPETGAEDGLQIYYFKGNKTRSTYPKPDYYAALVSAQIQIKIQKFHMSELSNNFLPSGMITVTGQKPSNEIIDQYERKIADKFTNDGNQARFMLNFSDGDGQGMTFQKFSGDDFDDRYSALAESSRENLFISLRALPILFGIQESTGFNKAEYQDAFALYNKTAISPKQDEIVKIFRNIFGETLLIEFLPFEIEFTTDNTENNGE